jgi:hypothetical protein
MANEGTGIVIGVLAIVIVILFYLGIVGHIVFSYQIYFSFWDRVAFVFFALLIIFGLFLVSNR